LLREALVGRFSLSAALGNRQMIPSAGPCFGISIAKLRLSRSTVEADRRKAGVAASPESRESFRQAGRVGSHRF
jgi:hypothetical protein